MSIPAASLRLAVAMSYVSADGQGGYPGEARARVEYRFVGPSRLRVRMTCETTAPCPVNMVQHAFYNLAGHASAKVCWCSRPRCHSCRDCCRTLA